MTTAIITSAPKRLIHMDLSGLFGLLSALCIGCAFFLLMSLTILFPTIEWNKLLPHKVRLLYKLNLETPSQIE